MTPTIEAERDALRAEVERLKKLAYLGEHHFDDLTYKARLDELVPQHRALEAEVERLREERDAAVKRSEYLRAETAAAKQDALHAEADNERLLGLIHRVESSPVSYGDCPWCGGDPTQHDSDCPAFSAQGEVRR